MNVYDFDHTIYLGDSTFDFWRYCALRHPGVLRALPRALVAAAGYAVDKRRREAFKAAFYRFLRYLPDPAGEVERFWDKHAEKLAGWYLAQKRPDDLVISASPEFLIGAVCTRLGIAWLASPVNLRTGALEGANCRDAEKVRRFRQKYPDGTIERFYSDSQSDAPLARLAAQAFCVCGDKIRPWTP